MDRQIQFSIRSQRFAMSDQIGRKETILWIDLIRVVAIFLVVMIHVSGQVTNHWGEIPADQWLIGNVYGGIARVAVPLFFMISGYLLLPRTESLRAFYTKRMMRILIPFVVWSLIYLGWYCWNHATICTPSFVGDLLFVQGTYYHLWFLYALIGIYMILPVLRLMIKPDMDQRILWYLIGLWLIFQTLFTITNEFWNFTLKITPPLATGFVCYFIFGYLLGGITSSCLKIILATILWMLGTLITIIGTYFFTRNSGQFDSFFYNFVSFNVILASGTAFLLLRWISERKYFASAVAQALTGALATSAFGIYLIHILVIEAVSGWIPWVHINSLIGNAIWSIPFVSILVFSLSFLIVRILQKIPVLKYIVP
jgi:surface polysaccharide O-acyltransferase-like enzyme